jgi:hypothetical protein
MIRTTLGATAGLLILLAATPSRAGWRSHRSTGQSPDAFSAEMESCMRSTIDSIDAAVRDGSLPREALRSAVSDRDAIRISIRDASSDGVITHEEDHHIRDRVDGLGPHAWGGGPHYYYHPYHHGWY